MEPYLPRRWAKYVIYKATHCVSDNILTVGLGPILKPLDDGSNEASKRTNYIDEQGNYHAPNGTIMTRELLNMFANGKLRNSLGDRVYFMPSFLDDIPPKGQKPVKLAPTPYRIFYDPKELEKAQC